MRDIGLFFGTPEVRERESIGRVLSGEGREEDGQALPELCAAHVLVALSLGVRSGSLSVRLGPLYVMQSSFGMSDRALYV